MKQACDGCQLDNTCSLRNQKKKCPCSDCLVKVVCIEICDDLYEYIMTPIEVNNEDKRRV
jgi:hypothetical protein